MKIFISFIIPVYNQSIKDFKNCIKSITQLSKKIRYEIIIVDDGSTKEYSQSYKATVKNMTEKNVKYYYKKNGGVSSARNFGITLAKGEYIGFVDADDNELVNNITIKDFDKKNDIIIYNVTMKYLYNGMSQNFVLKCQNYILSSNQILSYLLKDDLLNWVFAKFYKRSFLIKNNVWFDQEMKTGEDLYFNFQVLINSPKISYFSRPVYIYNYDFNSDFKRKINFPKRSLQDAEIIYKLRLNILNTISVSDGFSKKDLDNNFIDSIFYCYCGSCVNKKENIYYDCLNLINNNINKNNLTLLSKIKMKIVINRNLYLLRIFMIIKKIYRKIKPYKFK